MGLTACVSASLLQMARATANKMFPGIGTVPVPVVILCLPLLIGALVGCCQRLLRTAKFKLHPFIVTLATQLIVYGALLIVPRCRATTTGMSISGLDKSYTNFIKGSILSVPDGKGTAPSPTLCVMPS